MRGLEWSHPGECHVGKCDRAGNVLVTVSVPIPVASLGAIPTPSLTVDARSRACSDHVPELARILTDEIAERLARTAGELDPIAPR